MKTLEITNSNNKPLYTIEAEDYTDFVICRAYLPGKEKPVKEKTIDKEGRGLEETLDVFLEALP